MPGMVAATAAMAQLCSTTTKWSRPSVRTRRDSRPRRGSRPVRRPWPASERHTGEPGVGGIRCGGRGGAAKSRSTASGSVVRDVAEQLVGERAVRLREEQVAHLGDVIGQRAAGRGDGGSSRISAAPTRPCSTSEARCWRAPDTVMPRSSATSLGGGVAEPPHGVQHGPAPDRDGGGDRDSTALPERLRSCHRCPAYGRIRWLSPNSCHRYPSANAAS